MLNLRPEYITTGGNRHPSAADWDRISGLLAYGAGKNVAIWSPLENGSRGLRNLLGGHTGDVNAIKFYPDSPCRQTIILSGSVDRTIRVWRRRPKGDFEFNSVAVLDQHLSSVSCLAVCARSNLVASGSADATVNIWRFRIEESNVAIELVQRLHIEPRFFPLALSLHSIDATDSFILVVAGTSNIVQVYAAVKGGFFAQKTTLTGHEGWVHCLAISRENDQPSSDLILASGSQDKYIRLWRFAKAKYETNNDEDDFFQAFELPLSNKAHKIALPSCTYVVTFEALLLGHEDWIYTIMWRLEAGHLRLLSSCADNSLAIWQSEQSSGVWLCTTRLGEINPQKGSITATGSSGGFWIGLWSPNGDSLVSLGKTGGWRLWTFDKGELRWVQCLGVTGHTKAVTDIAWEKQGSYILSTSSDQTTRMHAAWNSNDSSWHEMARPQIHGYNLNCIDCIDQARFVSGADEKLLRVFDEPRATATLLGHICGVEIESERKLPDAAKIPVLGLSNKVMESSNDQESFLAENSNVAPLDLKPHSQARSVDHPPFEDELARHTLWPEREKLYGHGYEISAVAANYDATLIATSCRASAFEHAAIRTYGAQDWREIKPSLLAHSLTVTALRFSYDDQYLLSVGRDRQWTVFERSARNPDRYLLKYSNSRGHTRMVLDASWAPLDAGRVFMTASRDKTVKTWRFLESGSECKAIITASSPVTAVDISPQIINSALLVACGTEIGAVLVYAIQISDWTVQQISDLETSYRPSDHITRLAWRPSGEGTHHPPTDEKKQQKSLLAVASADGSVRLFSASWNM